MTAAEVLKAVAAKDSRYATISLDGAPAKITGQPKIAGLPCIHRGEPTGRKAGCQTCGGNVQLKLFACEMYGTCTLAKRIADHGCCDAECVERVAPSQPERTGS